MRKACAHHNNPIDTIRGYADGNQKFEVVGYVALVLVQLMQAGNRGCSPEELGWARLTGPVSHLRKAGLVIETIYANSPMHGRGLRLRYTLRSQITLTDVELAEEYRSA
jgi:hypothetical protein